MDAVITTVDTGSVIDDLTGDQLIQDRGIPTAAEDGRAIAEVVASQLEYANAAVLSSDDETARALVRAINPQLLARTTPAGLLGVRLHDPAATATVEPGSIVAPLQDDGPVRTLVWQSDRPFHPERLYDALEDLVAGTARGRGTVWIATQHRNRLSWDSFGTNISIGVLGPWLADLPADRWSGGRAAAPGPLGPRVAPRVTATARRTCRSPGSVWTSGNYASASMVVSFVRMKRSTP